MIESLHLSEEEVNRWKDITKKMTVLMNEDGILEQFEGYFKLKVIKMIGKRC